MATFCGTLNKGLNRQNFIIVKVRQLQKEFFGRTASMHPRNYIKNWQASPTSGTSPKEELKSFNFFQIQSSSIIYNFIPAITSRYTQSNKKKLLRA